jgi:hypothetical protein
MRAARSVEPVQVEHVSESPRAQSGRRYRRLPADASQNAATQHHHPPAARGIDGLKLALGALGVVYGDIGTSPLYAIKECVTLPHGVAPVTANIFGVLSLVFW